MWAAIKSTKVGLTGVRDGRQAEFDIRYVLKSYYMFIYTKRYMYGLVGSGRIGFLALASLFLVYTAKEEDWMEVGT